jgi:hypothetical protein
MCLISFQIISRTACSYLRLKALFTFWDLSIFLIRQLFLSIVMMFFVYFSSELDQFSDDYKYINQRLGEKYPILNLELPLMLLMGPSLYVLINPSYERTFLFGIAGFIQISYLFVLSYRLYGITQTPDVRVYFSLNPFKKDTKGRRSISTLSVSFAKTSLECVKYAGGGVVICYGLSKAFMGGTYRSPVVDSLGCYVTGLKSDDEIVYSYGVKLIRKDISLKPLIVESDGYTVNPEKLKKVFFEKQGWDPYELLKNSK